MAQTISDQKVHFQGEGGSTSSSACILIPGAALLLANEQRNAYGLRYNDYERYR